MTMDLGALGTFDVVLLLGVIYHLEEPLRALRRLRQVTHGFAAIETEAVLLPGRPGRPLWQFVDAAQLNNDPSIWWVPTAEGLRSMCLAAGFAKAEVVAGPPKRSRIEQAHCSMQSTLCSKRSNSRGAPLAGCKQMSCLVSAQSMPMKAVNSPSQGDFMVNLLE